MAMTPAQVRAYALTLPDAGEEPQLTGSFFRVRGRIFATIPPARRHVHVFLPPEECERAVSAHPGNAERLVWSGEVVGVSVRLDEAVPRFVERLMAQAWARDVGRHLLENAAIRISGGHRRIVV